MELTKVEHNLIFLFAILCSMNALMIGGVSINNFILLILLIYHLVKYRTCLTFNFKSTSSKFAWLMLLSIILSIFASMLVLPKNWIYSSLASLAKFILVYGYFFMLQPNKKIGAIRPVFFNGLYIGAIIQMVWGFLQEILYLTIGLRLNTFIFGDIFGENSYMWDSYISGNILRMKGLGWETANFALILIIGYIISCQQHRNIIIRFLLILAIFFSTSRSGYIAFAVVLLLQAFQLKSISITSRKLLGSIMLASILCLLIFIFRNLLLDRWQIILQSFQSVFQDTDINSSSSIHSGYYNTLGQALNELPLPNLLLGIGYFSSGYFYNQNALTLNLSPLLLMNPLGWNPESDFVTLIIGNGLLGIFVYYFWSIKGIFYQRHNYYSLLIVAVIVSGITYLTIRGTWSGLVLAFALYRSNAKNFLAEEKK